MELKSEVKSLTKWRHLKIVVFKNPSVNQRINN